MVDDKLIKPTERKSVLLVEDDLELASLVQDFLGRNGFDVQTLNTGAGAVDTIIDGLFDLVILDVMLPQVSGMDICREVRPRSHSPIIMLTALDDDMDQMLGLELGADDYIIKPVHPRVLLSRVRALLRRVAQAPPNPTGNKVSARSLIEVGMLSINLSNRSVQVSGNSVCLTSAEFELLLILADDMGSVVSRDTILKDLRGFEYDGLDRSIDRRVSRLRKKLHVYTDGVEMIKTVRGKGYQLCLEYASSPQSSRHNNLSSK